MAGMMRSTTLFLVLTLVGCTSALNGLRSTTARLDAAQADALAAALQGFPDPALRDTFVRADGRPAEHLRCTPCRLDTRRLSDRFDFLLIGRDAEPVNDAAELAARNAAQPLEKSDVGQAFMQMAAVRGHAVAVYGPMVNRAILQAVSIGRARVESHRYYQDLSSALVEVGDDGRFISVLSVEHVLQQSVIQSDFPGSRDVYVDELFYLFPESTARYLQERLPRDFTEAYRLR